MFELSALKALISPQSVAIIGASDDPERIGGRPISYLKKAGFRGAIYPVNPRRSEIQGLACYPSITNVPDEVDCAIIAVSAEQVLATARDCAAKGVRSAIIFSSGFAELGGAGLAAQAELTALARSSGMRILGPNIVGLYNSSDRAFLTFSGAVEPVIDAPASRIGIVSQSGGYSGYLLAIAQERRLGFGKWLTTGNEADVELSELIAYLAADPETDVILGYVEGIKSGARFVEALRLARAAGKPVILFKVGRTQRGAEAAASHTASLAGADNVFEAVCREYGVHRAANAEEMLDVAYAAAASGGRLLSGNRIGVMTVSGGVGAQIADLADECGLTLPQVPTVAQKKLLEIVPFASPRNPVDITAQITNDPTILERSLEILFETGEFDATLVFLGHAAAFPALAAKFVSAVAAVRARHPDRILALCALGDEGILEGYERAGCLVFREPSRAVAALSAMVRLAEARRRPVPLPRAAAPAAEHTGHHLNEFDAKDLLARSGVGDNTDRVARTAAEAVAAAEEIGFPVVVKILSKDVLHKSDVGGVALGLADAAAVEAAATAMLRDVPARIGEARLEGLLVSRMASGGTECIVGLSSDPVFGPVLMFGLGGIAVELLRDVTFRIAPVTEESAREMVREVRSFPLLDGYRGRVRADIDALANALVAISRLGIAAEPRIMGMEINPLLVRPRAEGVVVLDALVEIAATTS